MESINITQNVEINDDVNVKVFESSGDEHGIFEWNDLGDYESSELNVSATETATVQGGKEGNAVKVTQTAWVHKDHALSNDARTYSVCRKLDPEDFELDCAMMKKGNLPSGTLKKQSKATFEISAIAATTASADRAVFNLTELAKISVGVNDNLDEVDNITIKPDKAGNTDGDTVEVGNVAENASEIDDTGDTVANDATDCIRSQLISKAKLFSDKKKFMNCLCQQCYQMKQLAPIPIEIDLIIDEIFDDLLPFRFDISNMACWENESNLDESKFTSKFENILDLLFNGSGLSARGGEGTSQSTKKMAIFNDHHSTFRRRSDTLVFESQNDELSNIEFKKTAAQNSLVNHQQSKNIRINSCILNQINLMTDSTDNTILYYDFIGRLGYLAQLFEYENVYICQKLQSITIPACMLEFELFRSSLKFMFVWKHHMINLNNNIILANLNKEQQILLTDISSTISPPHSPSRNVRPVQVYLSLSNSTSNKRTRSVFEESQK
ncbi:MAG: hypothetical protein EXX96DRAFT_623579 [Benjaminiella poitrasii]|nr:MAG: hypothetical protein EXX96DRAFT_623579 [Benjaminiella poitrasii]